MAITIQRVPDGEDVWGRTRIRFVDVILDTSYPTGGYLINAADVGMKGLYSVDIAGQNTGSETWLYTFNINAAVGTAAAQGVIAPSVNMKLFTAPNAQLANATNVSTATLRLQINGR